MLDVQLIAERITFRRLLVLEELQSNVEVKVLDVAILMISLVSHGHSTVLDFNCDEMKSRWVPISNAATSDSAVS